MFSPVPRSGPSVCRNIGMRKAKSPFLIFLDADDLLAQHCLKQRLEYVAKNPSLDFAVFPVQNFRSTVGDDDYVWPSGRGDTLTRFVSFDIPWQTSAPIWSSRFLAKGASFPEYLCQFEDVVFHAESIIRYDPSFVVVRNATVDSYYRIGEERKLISDAARLRRVVDAAIVAHDHLLPLAAELSLTLQRAVRGTLWTALREIDAGLEFELITIEEYRKLYDGLERAMAQSTSFSPASRLLWRTYHQIVGKVGRIKGIGHLTRKAILAVP